MATKKQAAWRAEFARRFGGKKRARKTRSKRGVYMAKKGRRSSSGGFGGKKILPVGGMLGSALLGLGAAAAAKRFLGAPLGSFTGAAAGFAVGGIGGAAGGWLHDNIGNVGGASSSSTTLYG